MEKKIFRRLIVSMVISAVVLIATVFAIQTANNSRTVLNNAKSKLVVVKDTIEANNVSIDRLTNNVGDNNLAKARELAELFAAKPELLDQPGYLAMLSQKIGASCICIIDGNGIITHSDNEGYIGYDMGSSEQSAAFNVILTNPDTEIVQKPMMNGATGEMCQYVGVRRLDVPGYLQIELKPNVLTEALSDTALDVVLGKMDFETNGYVFAIEEATGLIVAHANTALVGKTAKEAGFLDNMNGKGTAKLDGTKCWYYAESYAGYTIGVAEPYSNYFGAALRFTIIMLISLTIVDVILIIAILRIVRTEIVYGINNINSSVTQIAAGDYSVKINEKSQVEFEELSNCINAMVDSIKLQMTENNDLIDRQQADVVETQQLFADVKQVCADLDVVSRSTLETAESINTGSANQETAVLDMRDKMGILSEKLSESATSATNISGQTMKAVDGLVETRNQIDKLSESMNEITETSRAIERIISEIDEIASQTNLLALNASIEAARAGDAGRGFAVVATEIGQLAGRSSDASKETQELIQNSIRAVNNGSEMTKLAVDGFTAAVERIRESSEAVNEVSHMVAGHMSLVREAERSLDQISKVVDANAEVAKQSKAAAERMAEETDKLYTMVDK